MCTPRPVQLAEAGGRTKALPNSLLKTEWSSQFQIQSLPKIAQTHIPNQSPLCIIIRPFLDKGLSWWLSSKESTCNAEDTQETRVQSLDLEDAPGEGNGNPLQYSYLENPMVREVWQATVHGVTGESDTTWQLNINKFLDKPRENSPTTKRHLSVCEAFPKALSSAPLWNSNHTWLWYDHTHYQCFSQHCGQKNHLRLCGKGRLPRST